MLLRVNLSMKLLKILLTIKITGLRTFYLHLKRCQTMDMMLLNSSLVQSCGMELSAKSKESKEKERFGSVNKIAFKVNAIYHTIQKCKNYIF